MNDEVHIVIASRGKPRVAGSVKVSCWACMTDVWIAPSSQHIPNARYLCFDCADKIVDPDEDRLVFTREQLDELRRYGR